MRRTNLDRLKAAAARHASRGPYRAPEVRLREQRRAEADVIALLDAIESGDPMPGRSYPRPLSEAEKRYRQEAMDFLDARRAQITEAAVVLRASGHENDLTRAVEKAGLMPEGAADGQESDAQGGGRAPGAPQG
jgi:hypothetical protein